MARAPRPIVIRLSTEGLASVQGAFKSLQKHGQRLNTSLKRVGDSADRAKERLARIGRVGATAGRGLGIFAASATALAVGIGALTKISFDGIDENIKFARSVGMTVEEFQKLRYAAEQGGVPVEDLRGQLFALSNVSLAAFNGDEGAAENLARLGVSAVDANGNLKTTYQSFLDIADAVSKVPDSLQKTASLAPVFGDGKLITTLNAGSAGIRKYGDEAERLGLLLSTEQSELVERTNDSVDNLGRTVASARDRIALLLAPDIERAANRLASFIAENRKEIDAFAKSSFTFIRQSLVDIYNVLYNGAAPEMAWVASAAQSIRDIQSLLTGQGEIQSPFLASVQKEFRTVSAQAEVVREIFADIFALLSGNNGDIQFQSVRDLIEPFEELKKTVSDTYDNVLKPVLTQFGELLDTVAAKLNEAFGLSGESRITGSQLVVALAVAKLTGLLGILVSVAGVTVTALTSVATAVLAIASGTLAAVAALAFARKQTGDVSRDQRAVAKRVREIEAENGSAAAAAYQKAYLEEYEKKWGFRAANAVANLLGFGADIGETQQQLDVAIATDPEQAKKGLDLALIDMGLKVGDDGIASLQAKIDFMKAQIDDSVTDDIGAVEGGIRFTSFSFSDEVDKKLQKYEASIAAGSAVPGFSTGGQVFGPGTSTSDSILSRLSRGEFVIRAASVRKFGADFFERLNSGVLPAFATGGLVSMPAPAAFSSVSGMTGGGGGRPVLLQLPDGSTTELRGNEDAVSSLEKKLRRSATAQTSRKPGWYK